MGSETYQEFRDKLESGPHKQLHLGIGGEMDSISSSNGEREFYETEDDANSWIDPLFFVHHAQIDRLWWLWQQQKPSQRDIDFAGPKYDDTAMAKAGANVADKVLMLGLGKDRPVKDLLTTKSEVLCYKYSMDL